MTKLPLRIFIVTLALIALSIGCSSSDDGGTQPPAELNLSGVTLSTSSGQPMDHISIIGFPSAKSGQEYNAIFLDADGLDAFTIPIEIPTAGLPWFQAPFHPYAPNNGGSVQLLVAIDEARSPVFDLTLGTLPAAPGSFATFVSSLQDHIDQRAQQAGSSFTQLAATSFDDISANLLPLKTAQSFVDDPGNPNCLGRIVDGSSNYLDAEQLELLDRIFGFAHVDSLVQADIDTMAGNNTAVFEWQGDMTAKGDCVNMGPTVSTASDLSSAMQLAVTSKIAIDPNGAPGQILGAAGIALGAAALAPPLGPVAALAGAGLYAYQTSRDYYSNTYPSSFVSMDFQLERNELPEDLPGFTMWSDVFVIAKSEGWVADKAIFDGIMQLVGAGMSLSQRGQIQESTFLRDAAFNDINMSLGIYLDGQPEGLVEFCSQQWRVDITDLPYSEGEAVIGRVEVNTAWRQIRPLEIGTDIIRVKAVKTQFGYNTISADLAIETKAIHVTATPDVITVSNPGEIVSITTTIEHADLQTLDWDPGAGSWNDGSGNQTNGPGSRPLLTPAAETDYPFIVVVESLSRQGLRESGTLPRLDTVTVKLETGRITVSPTDICVSNGRTESFYAQVEGLENTAVTWSLEPIEPGGAIVGSINQSGSYEAPATGSGEVFVVARSQENPDISGVAYVEVGACSCYWSLGISADGAWTGDYASHGFPAQFMIFTMSFDNNNPDTVGGGTVVSMEDGPHSGEVGSWDCSFTAIFDGRAWSGGDAEHPVTMEIFRNTGNQIEGRISGTVVTAINQEEFVRTINLDFRSGDLGSGEAICGE